MMRCSLLTALLLVGWASLSTYAADEPAARPINTRCPISKEPIDGKTFVTFQGKTIGFCCPRCDAAFNAWPDERKAAYIAAEESAPAPAKPVSTPAWTEPYNLNRCLVSDEEIGDMGKPVILQVEGREIRFCCKGCVPTFEKDPAKVWRKIDDLMFNDQLRYYPLKTCVVTGDPLESKGKDVARNVIVGNRLFRVASEDAEKKLRSDPAKYVRKLDDAVKQAQGPDYPLKKCVVAGSELGSMGEPTELVIAGRLLRFCCSSCEPKVKANPRKFLDAIDRAWNEKGRFLPPTTTRPARPKE
ncbi:MAG: hypothetical protein KDC38_02640 [Planctomycetes bacterium]|nr:hypothetical protein [Planctomycetota bacterium]